MEEVWGATKIGYEEEKMYDKADDESTILFLFNVCVYASHYMHLRVQRPRLLLRRQETISQYEVYGVAVVVWPS